MTENYSEIEDKEFAIFLNQAMEVLDLTVDDIVDRTGVPPGFVKAWLSGADVPREAQRFRLKAWVAGLALKKFSQSETLKAYAIEARTGCSCCSHENHVRGFYATKEEAERRIKYYLTEGNFFPLNSQYAKRGRYNIIELDIEKLPDGRLIINGDIVMKPEDFRYIDVAEDGSVAGCDYDYDSEQVSNEYIQALAS